MAKELTQTEIQEKILHSANKLFSEKGFDNVRMQDIADASGIPTAEITKYYPLKKDLYDAIIHGMAKHDKAKIKLIINHWNEKHLLEYDLEIARRRYDFLQKLMRQLGVDIVTDNQVEKLVETSAKLYKAAAKHGDNAKSA